VLTQLAGLYARGGHRILLDDDDWIALAARLKMKPRELPSRGI